MLPIIRKNDVSLLGITRLLQQFHPAAGDRALEGSCSQIHMASDVGMSWGYLEPPAPNRPTRFWRLPPRLLREAEEPFAICRATRLA